jgi:hypothetical protein
VDCHRNPAPHIRPRDQVFSMEDWPGDAPAHGREDASVEDERLDLVKIHQIASETDCSVCHR